MNILPSINFKGNQARELEKLFENSMRTVKQVTNSVHSKTLDTLYTDTFQPEHLHSCETTVMSLKDGQPIKAKIDYILRRGKDINDTHTREYRLKTEDKKLLGTKSFTLTDYENNNPTRFTFGYIQSNDNNNYAGTQIRLLQTACELAQKNDIKEIPLVALTPAVVFHTKMGFRPKSSFDCRIEKLQDVQKYMDLFVDSHQTELTQQNMTPIVSKRDGEYFFDKNKTLYCSAMNDMREYLKYSGKRNVSLSSFDEPSGVDMLLKDDELNKWNNRIKGFEILPDVDEGPSNKNIFMKIADTLLSII